MRRARTIRIRCVQCRRTAVRDWGGLGPLPVKCERCLAKNHYARNERSKKRVAAGRGGTAPAGGWRRCSSCRGAFQPPKYGDPAGLCPGCAEARPASRGAEPPGSKFSEEPGGYAPKGYRGYVATAKCVWCRRSVATLKPGRRTCCTGCLAKGLR